MDVLDQEEQPIIDRNTCSEQHHTEKLHITTITLLVLLLLLVVMALTVTIINNNKFSVFKRICILPSYTITTPILLCQA